MRGHERRDIVLRNVPGHEPRLVATAHLPEADERQHPVLVRLHRLHEAAQALHVVIQLVVQQITTFVDQTPEDAVEHAPSIARLVTGGEAPELDEAPRYPRAAGRRRR